MYFSNISIFILQFNSLLCVFAIFFQFAFKSFILKTIFLMYRILTPCWGQPVCFNLAGCVLIWVKRTVWQSNLSKKINSKKNCSILHYLHWTMTTNNEGKINNLIFVTSQTLNLSNTCMMFNMTTITFYFRVLHVVVSIWQTSDQPYYIFISIYWQLIDWNH